MRVRLSLLAFTAVAASAACCGCARTVSEAEFREIASEHAPVSFPTLFYVGRSGKYDYFKIYWNGRYRVTAPNELIGDQYFPYGTQQVPWNPWYSRPYVDPSGRPAAAPFELGEAELFNGTEVKNVPSAR